MIILLLFIGVFSWDYSLFEGTWVKTGGDYIPLYETYQMTFKCETDICDRFDIAHQYGSGESLYTSEWNLDTTKPLTQQNITSRVYADNPFMGLRYDIGDITAFSFPDKPGEKSFEVRENKIVHGSQGPFNLTIDHIFTCHTDTQILYQQKRNSRDGYIAYKLTKKDSVKTRETPQLRRKSNEPLPKREYRTNNGIEARTKSVPNPDLPTSYYIKIGYDQDWTLNGTVDEKILLISIAGLVNRDSANLYLLYPLNFTFALTHEQFNFYEEYTFNFVELKTLDEVLSKFSDLLPKSYVVWDNQVRTSVITSFTKAALNASVIVSSRLIPLVEKHGITTMMYDFRNILRQKSDFEIYSWALSNLWVDGLTNGQFVTWLGGECSNEIVPAIADFGMSRHTFYTDLNTKNGTEEYPLAEELMGRLTIPRVMGWHSYCKDLERDFTTLTSQHGGRVHGLNSFPNFSFGSKAPVTKGFKFENTHAPDPGQPKEKVYLGAIQTDGIGMGAWNKPGRGQIPYTWEVTMDDVTLFPTMLEMFYRNLTKNDFLCAALSSPSYEYPKASPTEDLIEVFKYSNQLYGTLDLNVMAVMDYSEGSTVVGNTDITKEVVDLYFEYIPSGIGFTNGYSPSFTFAVSDKNVPFISYDYYLDPDIDATNAVSDLRELGTINSIRPYFLVTHIREYSDESRVKKIFDALGDEYELVAVDQFLTLAGRNFTSKVRYEHGK